MPSLPLMALVALLGAPSLSEDVEFVRTGGPNLIWLADGRTLHVPASFDEVSTWQPGQAVSLEYSSIDGLTLGAPGGPRFEVLEVRDGLHPLDAEYERCRDHASTTVDYDDCIRVARERWDAELNRVYGILTTSLTPDEQDQLRDAQRKWIAFRDAQSESIAMIVGLREGSIHRLEAGAQIMELTRAQALRLQQLR